MKRRGIPPHCLFCRGGTGKRTTETLGIFFAFSPFSMLKASSSSSSSSSLGTREGAWKEERKEKISAYPPLFFFSVFVYLFRQNFKELTRNCTLFLAYEVSFPFGHLFLCENAIGRARISTLDRAGSPDRKRGGEKAFRVGSASASHGTEMGETRGELYLRT